MGVQHFTYGVRCKKAVCALGLTFADCWSKLRTVGHFMIMPWLGSIFTLRDKKQSKQWTAKDESTATLKKVKAIPSGCKVIAIVFWNSYGVIFVKYLQKGKTINGEYPKCELPKVIIRHNIGPISVAKSRLLLLGQCHCLHRSSTGPTTAAVFNCLNLPTFSWNLTQYRPYTKPIVIFTMASSSESRRTRVGLMDGTLLGHMSLLPRKTILEVRKPEFGTALARCCAERKCWRLEFGPELAVKCVPVLLFQQRQDIGSRSSASFWRCWASVEPYLTSDLGLCWYITTFGPGNQDQKSAFGKKENSLSPGQCPDPQINCCDDEITQTKMFNDKVFINQQRWAYRCI